MLSFTASCNIVPSTIMWHKHQHAWTWWIQIPYRVYKNTSIYNNHIFLIYNESNARLETSIKVISDRWYRGPLKRKSMQTQWENIYCNFLTTGCVPRRPPPGPPLRHPCYRRTHLRARHPQMKSTGAQSANEPQWPDPTKIGIPAMAVGGTLHIWWLMVGSFE